MVEGNIAAAVALPEAGHARFDAEAAALPVLVETVVIPDRERPGAYQAHVALQDVYELGQFINAGFAEKFSSSGNSGVVFYFEYRTAYLVQVLYFFHPLLRICYHGTELIEPESSFSPAHPILHEEHCPRGIPLYKQRDKVLFIYGGTGRKKGDEL